MRPLLLLSLVAAALSLASCYYDPYSYGWSGGGYSSVGTSFVYTSSSHWIYDPWVRCYYDRRRHCYYDPWLRGYYPRGYCPRPVHGVPHPHGWNGRGHLAPPRSPNSRYLDNRRERYLQLRQTDYAWANQVRAGSRHRGGNWSQQRLAAIQSFGANPASQAPAAGRGRRGANTTGGAWGPGTRGTPPSNPPSRQRIGQRQGRLGPGPAAVPNTRTRGANRSTPATGGQLPQARQAPRTQARSTPQVRQAPPATTTQPAPRSRSGTNPSTPQGWSRLQRR